ncbi:MAG: FHA domain-containing protein [Actinomycetota bacterium]|nr:FHA domain-containing protein [Actinomycetota bacterium]
MEAHLEVFGPEVTGRVGLDGDVLTIGRDRSNDIVLRGDLAVSRRHAILERLAAGWSVSDLNSTNGTLVNGDALTQPRPLYPGDEIEVGETRLVYHEA